MCKCRHRCIPCMLVSVGQALSIVRMSVGNSRLWQSTREEKPVRKEECASGAYIQVTFKKKCNSKIQCEKCKMYHRTLLHNPKREKKENAPEASNFQDWLSNAVPAVPTGSINTKRTRNQNLAMWMLLWLWDARMITNKSQHMPLLTKRPRSSSVMLDNYEPLIVAMLLHHIVMAKAISVWLSLTSVCVNADRS